MRKRLVLNVFAAILVLLSITQIIIDWRYEANFSERLQETVKHPEFNIFIEIEDKTLYLLQDGKCIKRFPIAAGLPEWPSPLGYWRIVNKGDWGEGFGGSWMGLNVTWGMYGIHGTIFDESIGSAASHGCIRMFSSDAKELYDIVPFGTPVTIVDGCFGPFGTGFKSINPGDRGADVKAIQERLKELGFYKSWISGIYEDDLKAAIHKFQKAKGIEVTNTITRKCWLAMGFLEFE